MPRTVTRQYLKNMREHIAIVGRFSVTDDNPILSTNFERAFDEAKRHFKFSFYAGTSELTINQNSMSLVKLGPARTLTPEEREKFKARPDRRNTSRGARALARYLA